MGTRRHEEEKTKTTSHSNISVEIVESDGMEWNGCTLTRNGRRRRRGVRSVESEAEAEACVQWTKRRQSQITQDPMMNGSPKSQS